MQAPGTREPGMHVTVISLLGHNHGYLALIHPPRRLFFEANINESEPDLPLAQPGSSRFLLLIRIWARSEPQTNGSRFISDIAPPPARMRHPSAASEQTVADDNSAYARTMTIGATNTLLASSPQHRAASVRARWPSWRAGCHP